MPINLNNLNANAGAIKKAPTAKFFNDKLTGRGGANGFFNKENDTLDNYFTPTEITRDIQLGIGTLMPNSSVIYDFPLEQLSKVVDHLPQNLISVPYSELFDLEDINQIDKSRVWRQLDTDNLNHDIYVKVYPETLQVETWDDNSGKTPKKRVNIGTRLAYEFAMLSKGHQIDKTERINIAHDITSQQILTPNGIVKDDEIYISFTNNVDQFSNNNPMLKDTLFKLVTDELKNMHLSDIIAHHGEYLSDKDVNTIDKFLQLWLDRFSSVKSLNHELFVTVNKLHYEISKRDSSWNNQMFTQHFEILKDAYAQKVIDQKTFHQLTNSNLRLMLANKLSELKESKDKDEFYKINYDADITQQFKQNPAYSNQQLAVITTQEPLVVGAAGAGTGKSHTLIGRLNFLRAQGQDLNNVLVLSFTNTAAKHIKQEYASIQSVTFADMFNQIYSNTFPNQMLTNPNTLSNTLKLLNPKSAAFSNSNRPMDDVVSEFTKLLDVLEPKGFKKVDLNEVMALMSQFIQDNMDDTILLLNAVGQTTLQLQPLIINAALILGYPAIQIPKSFQDLDIIITDESQDISTFEYIMLLDMALRRHAQLMIVGDGSQTLYEFRNSNPKFLTSIQASSVFTNYNLETNYRSNGAILAYANPLLNIIEANEEANIQLIPQDLTQLQPTEDEFNQHIKVSNWQVTGKGQQALSDSINEAIGAKTTIAWIADAIARGEKVAVLGATNKSVDQAYETLPDALHDELVARGLPDVQHERIQPSRQKPNDIVSSILTEMSRADLIDSINNSTSVIDAKNEVLDLMDNTWRAIVRNPKSYFGLPSVAKKIVDTIFDNAGIRYAVSNKQGDIFAGEFIQRAINEETRLNNMRQYIDSNSNNFGQQIDNGDVIYITGHSAKGLEFDNVVVLYDETNRRSSSQESLRMLYVTLTRAKENELILNFVKQTIGRVVGNTYLQLADTPINSLQLMSKHYAQTGEYETQIDAKTSKD